LQIKILQIGKASSFLATLVDPPDSENILLSLKLLRQLKALDENENLTPLGYHLAHLPVHPQIGKFCIIFFTCISKLKIFNSIKCFI
jgi:ATP-dependent RNA helicase DHX36